MFFKICFRYKAVYAKNFPKKGPFIIASNHLSFLDPAAVGLATKRRVSFLARESLFKNRIFNLWGRAVGAIPVKRGRFDLSAIKGSLECLKNSGIISLFPEGTRSKDGIVNEPKAGVGFLAAKGNFPVVPVCVRNTDKALPPRAIFIRLKPVETRVGNPIYPEAFLNKDGDCDYQRFSQEVMKRVEELNRD